MFGSYMPQGVLHPPDLYLKAFFELPILHEAAIPPDGTILVPVFSKRIGTCSRGLERGGLILQRRWLTNKLSVSKGNAENKVEEDDNGKW